MNPGRGNGGASRAQQVALEAGTSFRNNEQVTLNEPSAQEGGPYAVKDAAHPHDRMEERTPFHRDGVDELQRVVDQIGLPPGVYHIPLRGKGGEVLGYAQFKGVPNRASPVLATILAPYMRPGGTDLSALTKRAAVSPATNVSPREQQLFSTDQLATRLPEGLVWNGRYENPGAVNRDYAIRRGFDNVAQATTSDTPDMGFDP